MSIAQSKPCIFISTKPLFFLFLLAFLLSFQRKMRIISFWSHSLSQEKPSIPSFSPSNSTFEIILFYATKTMCLCDLWDYLLFCNYENKVVSLFSLKFNPIELSLSSFTKLIYKRLLFINIKSLMWGIIPHYVSLGKIIFVKVSFILLLSALKILVSFLFCSKVYKTCNAHKYPFSILVISKIL
jgi:hypothetical protein